MYNDENVPIDNPKSNIVANSFKPSPPIMYKANTAKSVVSRVSNVLDIVCVMDLSITSIKACFVVICKFSRTRSKIMMVSLTE